MTRVDKPTISCRRGYIEASVTTTHNLLSRVLFERRRIHSGLARGGEERVQRAECVLQDATQTHKAPPWTRHCATQTFTWHSKIRASHLPHSISFPSSSSSLLYLYELSFLFHLLHNLFCIKAQSTTSYPSSFPKSHNLHLLLIFLFLLLLLTLLSLLLFVIYLYSFLYFF